MLATVLDVKTIADRIRYGRAAAGLTQQELADLCGVTVSAAGQWEMGDTEPTRENMPKVAKALRVDLMWLTYGVTRKERSAKAG